MIVPLTLAEIRKEVRELKAYMRAHGIRRVSCFNGGHSADSYRVNARLFELETWRQELERQAAARAGS